MAYSKLLSVLLFLQFSLIAQSDKAQLTGTISDYPNSLVRIRIGEYPHNRHMCFKDSTLTDENGNFAFRNIDIAELMPVVILLRSELTDENSFAEYNKCGLVWLEKGTVAHIKASKEHLPLLNIQSNLTMNNDQLRFIEKEKTHYDAYLETKKLYLLYENDTSKIGKAKAESLASKRDWGFINFGIKSTTDFAKTNPNSALSAHILYLKYNNADYFGDFNTLDSAYNLLSSEAKNTKYGQKLALKIKNEKASLEGKFAPNFTLTDREGKIFSLSDYKGKCVVLDFWGSWCYPCRKEHPHLRQVYEKYKGLEIVMLACKDYSKEKWYSAIEKDNIQSMRHVWVDHKDPHNMTTLFDVTGFPTKIVIDTEGYIVTRVIGYGEEEETQFENAIKKSLKL
jgi:thiol-disulfide isomerase/thioredoxin